MIAKMFELSIFMAVLCIYRKIHKQQSVIKSKRGQEKEQGTRKKETETDSLIHKPSRQGDRQTQTDTRIYIYIYIYIDTQVGTDTEPRC